MLLPFESSVFLPKIFCDNNLFTVKFKRPDVARPLGNLPAGFYPASK